MAAATDLLLRGRHKEERPFVVGRRHSLRRRGISLPRIDAILGSLRLGLRTARAFGRLVEDELGDRLGNSLPATKEAFTRRIVVEDLLQNHTPEGQMPLPRLRSVSLPGVDFESSNCTNFLIEMEFEGRRERLPRTAYVKIPCPDRWPRAFANALGFWSLECLFASRIAQHVPIRVPKVYAVAERGSRFVLMMENLVEGCDARMFLNRDMAAGTTPERAERVLRCFADLHAHFWGWSRPRRESLLPREFDTYRGKRSRRTTPALNRLALDRAHETAPEFVSESIVETCHFALDRWDAVLEGWFRGPLTLCHGDSHLGNCFEYPTDEGPKVGMIDFQAVQWTKGIRDVQYFLINSMEPDVLAAYEETLIRGYCDELGKRGVDLVYEDAFEQYRAFTYQTLMVGVVPLGLGGLTERNETVLAVTRRSARAVERLGFRDWVAGL